MVYLIEKGSLILETMSAKAIAKMHIDDAERIQKAINRKGVK